MFVFLSKLAPNFIYPLGLACILLCAALVLRRSARWRTALVVIALLLLWVPGTRWVALPLVRSLEWQYLPIEPLPEADAIVLLGGGTESAEYPRLASEINGAGDRVLHAARIYRQNKAPLILLSGGNITWLGTRSSTPAQEMAEILELMGVPSSAMILENESRNTYENATYARSILEARGIRRIILVTSAQHMPRSVALFKHQGFEVIPSPADFSLTQAGWDDLTRPDFVTQLLNIMPGVGGLSQTTGVLKEYLGMLAYRFQGWID